MNIGLDMMGGDFAPLEAVKGHSALPIGIRHHAHLVLLGMKKR